MTATVIPETMDSEMEAIWRQAFNEQCHRRHGSERGVGGWRRLKFPESAEQFAYRCLRAHLMGQPKPKPIKAAGQDALTPEQSQ